MLLWNDSCVGGGWKLLLAVVDNGCNNLIGRAQPSPVNGWLCSLTSVFSEAFDDIHSLQVSSLEAQSNHYACFFMVRIMINRLVGSRSKGMY
jgi:hypothetical protein